MLGVLLAAVAVSSATSSVGLTYLREAEVRQKVHECAEAPLYGPAKTAHLILRACGAKRLAARVRLRSAIADAASAGDDMARRVREELEGERLWPAAEAELILLEKLGISTPNQESAAAAPEGGSKMGSLRARAAALLEAAKQDAKAERRKGHSAAPSASVSAASAAPPAPLPPQWYSAYDQVSGRTYYWHEDGRTTWEHPAPVASSTASSPTSMPPAASKGAVEANGERARLSPAAQIRANLASLRKRDDASSGKQDASMGKKLGIAALLLVAMAGVL